MVGNTTPFQSSTRRITLLSIFTTNVHDWLLKIIAHVTSGQYFEKNVVKTHMTAIYNICSRVDNNTPFQSSTWRVTLFNNFTKNVQDMLPKINAHLIQDH